MVDRETSNDETMDCSSGKDLFGEEEGQGIGQNGDIGLTGGIGPKPVRHSEVIKTFEFNVR